MYGESSLVTELKIVLSNENGETELEGYLLYKGTSEKPDGRKRVKVQTLSVGTTHNTTQVGVLNHEVTHSTGLNR